MIRKTVLFIAAFFLFTGCYTHLKFADQEYSHTIRHGGNVYYEQGLDYCRYEKEYHRVRTESGHHAYMPRYYRVCYDKSYFNPYERDPRKDYDRRREEIERRTNRPRGSTIGRGSSEKTQRGERRAQREERGRRDSSGRSRNRN